MIFVTGPIFNLLCSFAEVKWVDFRYGSDVFGQTIQIRRCLLQLKYIGVEIKGNTESRRLFTVMFCVFEECFGAAREHGNSIFARL